MSLPAEIKELVDKATPEERAYIERLALASIARENDNPDAFGAFYELVYGNILPEHLKEFIDDIYAAKERDRASLIFAFRGSWKTTTISVGFTAFRVGKEPHKANLIVQANDSSAKTTIKSVADIIEYNQGWKLVFPNVVPDKDKGWGEGGYEVKREDMDYAKWRDMNASRKDPSLLGLGIGSSQLIGKHPDGVLILDDIHDEDNTISDKEREKVKKKVTDTILPMAVEDETKAPGQRLVTWEIAVGTPWTDDDAYHYLKNTGEFDFSQMPVMELCDEEDEGSVWFNHLDIVGHYRLNWTKRFSPRVIESWRNKSGKRGFARMYLLDLSAAKVTGFKYFGYPQELIQADWRMYGGVDFASVRDRVQLDHTNRDYFAMARLAKIPSGGAVIVDGDFGHYTQAQSEELIMRMQSIYPGWVHTVVEDDGKGEAFVDILLRKPNLRIIPMLTRGRAKRIRQEKMSALFEIGIVRISDADTPFLNMLRKSFDDYPDGNDDVRDAVYWALKAVPELWVVPDPQEEIQVIRSGNGKKPNPFIAFGSG